VALLVPLSLVKSGGIEGYRRFAQNTEKHASTPLTNYMGLRTAVAFSLSETGRVLRNDKLEDPWGAWKIAKLRTFRERKPIFFFFAIAFGVLLWYAVRGVEPWVACSLSTTMIAVGAELTCYYYAFLVGVALLYAIRREAGLVLLVVTAASSFIDWAPTRVLPNMPPWIWLHMPTWLDEQYMWMGVVTLLGFGLILYRFAFMPEEMALLEGESVGAPAPGQDAAAAPAVAITSADRDEAKDSSKDSPRDRRGGANGRKGRKKK
jgi:hypothetical protein